jgi:hypothetical protein
VHLRAGAPPSIQMTRRTTYSLVTTVPRAVATCSSCCYILYAVAMCATAAQHPLLLLVLCMPYSCTCIPSRFTAVWLCLCHSCRLAGHVHAGCDGDRSATISALELRGAHLVIANVKSLAAARVSSSTWIASVLCCEQACWQSSVSRLAGNQV